MNGSGCGQSLIDRKSCKTYENTVKFKTYALLHISKAFQWARFESLVGPILAPELYVCLMSALQLRFSCKPVTVDMLQSKHAFMTPLLQHKQNNTVLYGSRCLLVALPLLF